MGEAYGGRVWEGQGGGSYTGTFTWPSGRSTPVDPDRALPSPPPCPSLFDSGVPVSRPQTPSRRDRPQLQSERQRGSGSSPLLRSLRSTPLTDTDTGVEGI